MIGTFMGDEIMENHSLFDMTFDQTVSIQEYYYPEFSFAEFIASIGGSLGFWLGVGVVQLGEYASTLASKIKSILKIKNHK